MTAGPARGHVLVVEDDPDLAGLMELILGGAGYDVASARDGLEALRRLDRRMPGVILLDMRMPVMNGWEFARELRARYRRAAPPILVITAAEDSRRWAEEIRAEAWLEKPFDVDEVLRLVGLLLGGGGARTAAGV